MSLDLVALNLTYQLAQNGLRLIAHAAEHPCFLQVLLRLGIQPERGAELLLAALSLGLVLLELDDGALAGYLPFLNMARPLAFGGYIGLHRAARGSP